MADAAPTDRAAQVNPALAFTTAILRHPLGNSVAVNPAGTGCSNGPRDHVTFGWTGRFYDMRASEVLAAGQPLFRAASAKLAAERSLGGRSEGIVVNPSATDALAPVNAAEPLTMERLSRLLLSYFCSTRWNDSGPSTNM